ncbi:MAG: CDP-alcohol phosphatidyltransferase family protein [Actinomycetota bacterium]|nr:CDP-alcohol phosphatidyltransferase family protein [Actinomycetota bacterium]
MAANALTIFRIILIPVVFKMVIDGSPWAIVFFALAALTDLLDGPLARRSNNVTEVGRLLDPFADRLFISSIALALYIKGSVPPIWALGLLIARDALILGSSIWLKLKGREIAVTYLGKVATAVLLVSILLLVAGISLGAWIFYIGLALYLGSGFNYLARGKKLLDP